MKKVTLILIVVSALALFSCGNSDKKTNENSNNNSEQADKTEKQDLFTQQDFEKILSGYGITLLSDMKFENIKENSNDEIVATYAVNNLSEESNQEVKDYIVNELLKLKNAGWGVEESFGMAMKKENEYKVAIQINQSYAPDLKIHTIIYSYGKVY